jgi:hypothetical protein
MASMRNALRRQASPFSALVLVAVASGCEHEHCPMPTCDGNTLLSCEYRELNDFYSTKQAEFTQADCALLGDACYDDATTAACVDPTMRPCDFAAPPRVVGCSQGGVRFESCTALGYVGNSVEACQAGSACVEALGTADCVDDAMVACEPTDPAEGERTIWFCSSDGASVIQAQCTAVGYASWFTAVPCGANESCVPTELSADCVPSQG